MTLNRTETGEVGVRITIFRNGQAVTNPEGASDLYEFVRGIEIFEGINSATLEARIIFQDNAGLIGSFTGSELFKIQITGSVYDKTYFLRAYNIEARSRTNQNSEVYLINLASDEYIKNEVANVFGNTEVIFDKKIDAENIIKRLVQNQRYLGSKKRVFVEKTLNTHKFVAPNWRPFDCIYWMCNRSIREKSPGKNLQSGYVFFENSLGYHYKSIDKLIESANSQSFDGKTNPSTGEAKLYNYVYSPKKVSENQSADQFKINSVVFPEERNFLMGLRHGAWSGFSIGLDPVTISTSKMGASSDLSADAYRYSIKDIWKRMEHLKGNKNANPITKMDTSIQNMIDYPKRVRYTIMPNQIFDPKNSSNPQANYEQLVELQAYQWMRIESLKNVKLQIIIPGNLDLYAGYGINVEIPTTAKSDTTVKLDRKYSGRYIIAGLTHKILNNNMETELLLLKDSVQ